MSLLELSAKNNHQEKINQHENNSQKNPESDDTRWLRSPVGHDAETLQPQSHVELRPYYGRRRRLHWHRTEYTIGRSATSDVFWEDPFLSPSHARIKFIEGKGYLIEDLNSKNGVWLNGTRVQKAFLPRQANLRLGRSFICWDENSKDQQNEALAAAGIIAASACMQSLLNEISVLANGNIPVLLLGETGTGKDVLARILHQWSPRKNGAFVPLNAAQAEGNLVDSELFGHRRGAYTGADSARLGAILRAHNGTFFLDEVADLPASSQVKLLRTLETGEVKPVGADNCESSDFRLITATSRVLEPLLEQERFRWDFYYRIAGAVVRVPPLRERQEDIRAIAQAQAKEQGLYLAENALDRLSSFSWPGNIRQLLNCLALSCQRVRKQKRETIDADCIELPQQNQPLVPADYQGKSKTLEDIERYWIQATLARTGGGRSQAAAELGIARSTLFEKMRRYKISG